MDPTAALIQEIKRRYVAGELVKASTPRQITISVSKRSKRIEDGDVLLMEPHAYLVSDVRTEGTVQNALLWYLRPRSEPEQAE